MEQTKNIAYQPTDGLSYDPSEAKYWDPEALDKEIRQTYKCSNGYRLCFKYCDTFPIRFPSIDGKDGDVRQFPAAETAKVMDSCFQCKLCEVQCPYSERDGHEFKLDFPRLVQRYVAQKAQRKGLRLRDHVLGDPDTAGTMARASFGIANIANRVRLHRIFLEKVLGIHRDKLLPTFTRTTFERWAARAGKIIPEAGGEAVLFQTCYVQNNEPEIGRDTIEVLERNVVDVRCANGLECCGMPAWDRGDLESLRRRVKVNLRILLPFVEQGAKVIAINPTCS